MAKHTRGRRADQDAPFTLDSGETPGTRALRLQHLLFEELYRLFRMEVNDPKLADLVPTSVEMSSDLRNAKVMYALRDPVGTVQPPEHKKAAVRRHSDPQTREVQAALLRVTPYLRTRLADGMAMKRLPDLHFNRDRLAESSLRAQDMMTRERLAAAPHAAAVAPVIAAAAAEDDEDPDDEDAAEPTSPKSHPPESPRTSP